MIVPVEVRPVPVMTDMSEVGESLSEVRSADLPVFAANGLWQTHVQALVALLPEFKAHGLQMNTRNQVTFEHRPHSEAPNIFAKKIALNKSYLGYTLPHGDHIPTVNTPSVQMVSAHTTETGITRARFYEPTEEFVASRRRRLTPRMLQAFGFGNLVTLSLPKYVRQQLAESIVDDEIIVPVCHEIDTGPGTTLIFRSEGSLPVIHGFEDLVLPRISKLSVAWPIKDGQAYAASDIPVYAGQMVN